MLKTNDNDLFGLYKTVTTGSSPVGIIGGYCMQTMDRYAKKVSRAGGAGIILGIITIITGISVGTLSIIYGASILKK